MVSDVAVVGAGAAGLMTAITAKRLGLKTLLLDSKAKVGAKILMSGGTRCNITNDKVTSRDFQTETPRVLNAVLRAFPAEKAAQFFEDLGVQLSREPNGKLFPTTNSARTVLDALLNEVRRLGLSLETNRKVTCLRREAEFFSIEGSGFAYRARTVVLTTGGLSFPTTGSDGSGYAIAKQFSHTLVDTSPSLTPLDTDDRAWKALSGVSLPVKLTYWLKRKKQVSYEGSFLFTHFGFSGPVVLNMSRHWIRRPKQGDAKLSANFLPGKNEREFRKELADAAHKNPAQGFAAFLTRQFPERFVETVLDKVKVDIGMTLNQLPREKKEDLIRFLYHVPLSIVGDRGYAKAEVTAGGVSLLEVDRQTLESRKQPGLFLAGEICDVDGRIGGFNFQWAWSSGFVAASGCNRYVTKKTAHESERQ